MYTLPGVIPWEVHKLAQCNTTGTALYLFSWE